MKKIALVGLIYDTNLGDPAIYESTKRIVTDCIDCEIVSIDLYGRSNFEYKKDSVIRRLSNKIKNIICSAEDRIIKNLKHEIDTKLNESVDALIFVGGLIKYKHQFISKPVELIIGKCEELNIPVMLSAVGVEGYDTSDECQELKRYLNLSCVKVITTRDDIDTLKSNYVNKSIECYKVADPAVTISGIYAPSSKIRGRIGLGIGRKGLFSDYENDVSDSYVKELWIDAYKVLKREGFDPVFFTNGLEADYMFAKEIADEVGSKDVFNPSSLSELCKIISTFEFAIVTRLHSSIICYSYKIPTLNLVWNNKQVMFGEATHRSNCFMSPKEFHENLIPKLRIVSKERIVIDEDYKESTKQKINEFLNKWVKCL